MKRQRGRNSRRNNNSGNTNPNRSLDSNGPDVKVRGSANTIYEKYTQLARDAASSGNRIKAENYRQHAEHYLRLHTELQAKVEAQRAEKEAQRAEREAQRAAEREARQDSEGADTESEGGEASNDDGPKRRREARARRSKKDDNGDDIPSGLDVVTPGEAEASASDDGGSRRRRALRRKAAPSAEAENTAAE